LDLFQAINCLATIIPSLRDVGVHPLHGLTAHTPTRRYADTLLSGGFEIIFQSFLAGRYELFAFRNATSTYIRMNRFCFRITFQNEDAAFYQFHVFPPVVHIPWVSGWARKRNASTQLILVELKEEEDRDRFLELCCENPHVLKIEEISEDEFTATPSQAI
jgi:hypothetical protein